MQAPTLAPTSGHTALLQAVGAERTAGTTPSPNHVSRVKTELGDTCNDEEHATNVIYEYIDVFCKCIRIHSIHRTSPLKFELRKLLN
jgi:hypothetical protein